MLSVGDSRRRLSGSIKYLAGDITTIIGRCEAVTCIEQGLFTPCVGGPDCGGLR